MAGLCEPCREVGKLGAGTWSIDGKPMCDAHKAAWVRQKNAEAKAKQEDTTMKEKIDWNKVQNERSDGASVPALAKKYSVSQPTIYAHTRPALKKEEKTKSTWTPSTALRTGDKVKDTNGVTRKVTGSSNDPRKIDDVSRSRAQDLRAEADILEARAKRYREAADLLEA